MTRSQVARRTLLVLLAGLSIALLAGGASAPPAAADGDETETITCRNEIEFGMHPSGWGPSWLSWLPRPRWGDDHRDVQVPADAPQWWKDEVREESADVRDGFVGRGETDEWAEDTKNLGARGCDLAQSPPAPEGLRTCEEINAQKERLRQAIDDGTQEDLDDEDLTTLPTTGPTDAAVEEALRTLEFQGSIVPDDCWGTYPTSRYNVTWNPRSHWTMGGWTDRLTSWLSMLLFGLAQQALLLALWTTRVAYVFDIGDYSDTLAEMAGRIDRDVVHMVGHDLSLVTVAWFALAAGVGFMALRGKLARAGAELLAALVLATLFSVLLGSLLQPMPEDPEEAPAFAPDGYLSDFTDLMDQSSRAPLLVANGRSPDDEVDRDTLEDLLRNTHSTLHRQFVEDPALFINFGTAEFSDEPSRNGGRSCEQIVADILTVPDPPRTWPSNYLARYGCLDAATFNSNMSATRLASVVVVSLVGLVVATVVGLAGMTLLMAKFLAALLFVMLPVAALSAVLPGGGRRIATWWAGALVQLWLACLGMGIVLMLVLFSIHAVGLAADGAELSLAQRWVGLLVVMFTLLTLRKRLAAASQKTAGRVQQALERISQGGEPSGPLWRSRSGGGAAPARGAAPVAGGQQQGEALPEAPVGTGTVASLSTMGAVSGARMSTSLGRMALVAPDATKTALFGAEKSDAAPPKGGFDLGVIDRAASRASYQAIGATIVASSVAGGAAVTVARAYAAPVRWAYGGIVNEYGRRRKARINQSYRAQLSETEDQRSRRWADAVASAADVAARPGGHRFYDPAHYGVRTQRPSVAGPMATDKEIGQLRIPGLRGGRALRHMRDGKVVAPNGEVRYRVRYRWWTPVDPRLPRKVRNNRGGWSKVKPSRPMGSPWVRLRTVKPDGLPPRVRARDVPDRLRPRDGWYLTPRPFRYKDRRFDK